MRKKNPAAKATPEPVADPPKRGRGRPASTNPLQVLSFRISADVMEKLDAIVAAYEAKTRTSALIACIEQAHSTIRAPKGKKTNKKMPFPGYVQFRQAPGTSATAARCKNCGVSVGTAKFCPDCGTPVKSGPKFCPGCGAKADGAKFCQDCGQKLV